MLQKKGKRCSITETRSTYKPKNVELITACNYQHDLQKISETDWILEAVVEQLDIKEKVYSNLLPYLKESAILTSNTSGIPLSDLTKNSSYQCEKTIYDYALL